MTEPISFAGLGLASSLVEALAARGITTPMPVQAATIPHGLEGRDLLVQSQTGSGKTLAFGLPLVQRLEEARCPQALVLAPTRELAQQVALELRRLRTVDVALLVGGLGYGPQFSALERGCPVVVGTPGRIMDHLERGSLDLSKVRMVVLDECDEMLNMGFLEDVETILSKAPNGPQTFLFSATLPDPIARLAERFLKQPERINLSEAGQHAAHADIAHTPVQVSDHLQVKALVNLLLHDEPSAALIFTKTKAQSEEVAEELTATGLAAAFLHGDLAQATRSRILEQFKRGQLRFLVATDVAARGIDISALPLVVHVGVPTQMEGYVHRSGRTGRAGSKGTSLALVNPKEGRILSAWARRGGMQLAWRAVPTLQEIRAAQATRLVDRIREGATDDVRAQVLTLLETLDSETLAAGLLAMAQAGEGVGFDLRIPIWTPGAKGDRFKDRGEGDRKPWQPRGEGDRKPWQNRDGQEGDRPRRPWQPREGQEGDRKPWQNREGQGGERKPWQNREGQDGERKPWQNREGQGGERKPWQNREGQGGERKPWQPREGQEGDRPRKPWQPREGQGGERRPWQPREGQEGERRPWQNREGQEGDRPRRSWQDRAKEGDAHPRPSFPRTTHKGDKG